MKQLEKFTLEIAIDLSQGFYTIPLDEESQKICATVFPWGKYVYQCLTMGITCVLDMFPLIMMDLLGYLYYVLIFIYDVLIIQQKN